jgi:hypothetical protein
VLLESCADFHPATETDPVFYENQTLSVQPRGSETLREMGAWQSYASVFCLVGDARKRILRAVTTAYYKPGSLLQPGITHIELYETSAQNSTATPLAAATPNNQRPEGSRRW